VHHGKNNVVKGSTSITDNKNGTTFESKKVCLQQQLQGKEPHDKDSMEKVP
jgi:hypothetical protein